MSVIVMVTRFDFKKSRFVTFTPRPLPLVLETLALAGCGSTQAVTALCHSVAVG